MDAIEKRMQELREQAREYAKAAADRAYLDEYKKSHLAIIMKRYEHDYPSVAAQEREARADGEYLKTLEGLKAATEAAERLGWELRISMKGADLWQTAQANERAERRGYGAS